MSGNRPNSIIHRFAAADLVLKRTLAAGCLIGVVLGLYFGVVAPLLRVRGVGGDVSPAGVGFILGLWIATALSYPVLSRWCVRFVDRVVLRRPDYARFCADFGSLTASHQEVASLLDDVCARLSEILGAGSVSWTSTDDSEHGLVETSAFPRLSGFKIVKCNHRDHKLVSFDGTDKLVTLGPAPLVLIPTIEQPYFLLEIGELSSGRRFFSDEVAMLETVAVTLARRIDTLRVNHERCEQKLRTEELGKLATEAELRTLRAQINPHFLFNALTTIGYLIQTSPDRALETLMRLTELLRGVLRSSGEFTTLDEETDLIRSYLEIERARFEERLRVVIDVPDEACSMRIPTLIVQPLVENAVKHGIGPAAAGGEVTLSVRREDEGGRTTLTVTVADTGVGVGEFALAQGRKRGHGLANVESRLAGHFGKAAALRIESVPGRGTTVSMRFPASTATEDRTQGRRALGGGKRT